jgi:acetolactate synthase-1/2/3 large subunit
MKAAELLVKCLENEGVTTLFGIPGEENMDVMDALLDSKIEFVITRHEQGAAFMADVHGRLTGKAGVCLATLGPGATNLITGVADANMDHAPVVAIAGQAATTRLHKESHQVLDLVNLFKPISKYSTSIREPEIIPEIVRKAFKVSEAEKPGCSFIEFPENVAEMTVEGKTPLKVQSPLPPDPPDQKVDQAAKIISEAKFPLMIAGNGVIRANASESLIKFAEKLNIPVATTFMAKGAIPFSHPLFLGTVGLQARDYVACGFDRADVIICAGYDMVEYPPSNWHKTKDRKIVHIDAMPADVDEYYIVSVGVIGNIGGALKSIAEKVPPRSEKWFSNLRQIVQEEITDYENDSGFPVKPQKILWDLRQVLKPEDIVICDVGAHKMWMARLYQAEHPNTCIISNGFASMGIAVPGVIAAKRLYPKKTILAVTGDAGFMMNSQEIETAMRIGTPIVILIWNDGAYGLIQWKQLNTFGRESHVRFTNPDFIKYAQSFGAKGYRVERAQDLVPILKQAIEDNTVVIVDCPVDYRENIKLTSKLGELVCPI